MQGICHLDSNRKDKEFDGTVIRSSVLLPELLMKASPKIDPQFLVSFSLASTFDVNELHSLLLDVVGLNRQSYKSIPAICTVDKALAR
ncbi:hypothetical protein PanWU01x14_055250 [Parasponia andersonii]|uniref:Uncharacterized protein n=1 Tax=Parasponia andersonii TaxID=3476 RepID=A0A2P5DL44_PARAD|nr:hypothetical protein PanWU01x14_055250 [Parasponia andersonii]